ncbi:hypothetical protein SAY86_027004 [Trapa natans]|uniref:Uncharacterized protein n=1 Tax=Trapa natans TaxID=22666 RepID=A0AAN7KPY6_TRANT|nr:hypothetical protein SAY86_027004 [Trapa natans]
MVRKLVGSCMEGGRDKQCSTTSDISQVSSSEDQKLNTSHNRASKERASNQIRGAKKAPHSPDGDISCISGLHMSNTVVNNCSNDDGKKNNDSGSSVSVNSFPSS